MQLRFGIHQFIYVRNAFRGHWSGLTQLKICHNLFANKNIKEFLCIFRSCRKMSLICRRKQSNSTSREWKNFLSNSLGSRSVNNLSIEQISRINYALWIRFTNQIHFAVKGYRKMVEFTSKALPRDRGYRSNKWHQRHFGRSAAPFRQHRSQQPCKQRNSRVPPVRPALAHKRTWNTRQPFILASRCEHYWAFLS